MIFGGRDRKDANRAIAYLFESSGMEWISIREALPFACEVTGVNPEKKRRSQIAVECYSVLTKMGIVAPDRYIVPWHRHEYERMFTREASRGKYIDFYDSWEWKKARYSVLMKYGRKCMCCGSVENIVVDHIIPLKRRWDLRLDVENLQVLCSDCNMGKSNNDRTDFRKMQ